MTDPSGPGELRRLFEAALERPPAERRAWLERACPSPAVRRDVLDLLAVSEDEDESGWLDDLAARAGVGIRGREASARGPDPHGILAATRDELQGRIATSLGAEYGDVMPVGSGGMGVVFRAHHRPLDRTVAVKVLAPELLENAEARARFEQEARSAAGLAHPNVVPIYTVSALEDGLPYLTMRFVAGGSLAETLDRDGSLPPDRAMAIVAQIASALEAAHRRGIVHRDVKPGNVLIDPDATGVGGVERVLLTDFGIAKAGGERDAALTSMGSLVGSPRYMSPEQAAGDDLDARSDLYSLGVLAYELIAGRTPFDADSMHRMIVAHLTEPPPPLDETVPGCPEGVAAVVHRCLEKDPARRFASAAELNDAIDGALAGPRPRPRSSKERRDDETVRGARIALAGALAASVAALALDRALLGGYTLSALVVVGAATVGAEATRRLWLGGFALRQLFRRTPGRPLHQPVDVAPLSEDRAETLRRGRAERALLLRTFHRLPRAEQAELPRLRSTVDRLVRDVAKAARELDVLDRGLVEGNGPAERTRDGRRRAEAEMMEARGRLQRELEADIDTLAEVRTMLERYLTRGSRLELVAVHARLEEITAASPAAQDRARPDPA